MAVVSTTITTPLTLMSYGGITTPSSAGLAARLVELRRDLMTLLDGPAVDEAVVEAYAPLLRLDAAGWSLRSVASIISTSGSVASDADNSEKIGLKHPCLTSGGNGCRGFCGGHKCRGIHPALMAPSE